MKKILITVIVLTIASIGCSSKESISQADKADSEQVQRQQSQYAKGQPIPVFDWSLERQRVIELYKVRNQKAATHSVWRSDFGAIEGDCPSQGYGIPYDTSLTNPLTPVFRSRSERGMAMVTVEQPEPNGIFASKNTAATWVLCLGETGTLEPVYVEAKVTVYPGPVKVDYETDRVTRSGAANVLIKSD